MSASMGGDVVEFCDGREACRWTSVDDACIPTSRHQAAVLKRLTSAFVPEGTVSPDYYDFQVWDSLQGLCSYVRGMLSSHAILRGVGVGSKAATPGSAVFHFFMRDFSGMLGGVLFAMLNGGGLDSYAKQWRLFADCFNNVGYLLELISPLFPSAFLLLACLGSIARSITGVAAGATRAALTQHFAQSGNAADVSAKEGSQETAVNLIGMLLGMGVVHLAEGNSAAVWAVFLALTVLHIYANVRAMRSLQLTSLNRPRFDILLASFTATQTVPSVVEVAAEESLLAPPVANILNTFSVWFCGGWWLPDIQLGCRFSELDLVAKKELLKAGSCDYICWDTGVCGTQVPLAPSITKDGLLRAYAAARLGYPFKESKRGREEFTDQEWELFKQKAKAAGWRLENVSLGASSWRVDWSGGLHRD